MRETERGEPLRLGRKLGSGGMGTVYEAWDDRLGRRVALKFIHPHLLERPGMRERFDWEARAAARVVHPNVVPIYRTTSIDGQPAMEMQFVVGTPLREILRGGSLSPEQAARLLEQLLLALSACHAEGVVHCDLKPGNLLVTAEEHLYLSDFGVARALYTKHDNNNNTHLPENAWGTPWYSPPEAFRGEAPAPAWDLYAAGIVAFEMLTGEPPFPARTPQEWMDTALSTDPPGVRMLNPRVSTEMAALVKALTARNAAARPGDAVAALRLLRGTPEARTRPEETLPPPSHGPLPIVPSDAVPPGHSRRGRLAGLAGALLCALMVVALIGGGAWRARQPSSPTPTASESVAPTAKPPDTDTRGKVTELVDARLATYFAFDDGIHGLELWQSNSDGLPPKMVADLMPGAASSNPRHFMLNDADELYFAATSPEGGEELWKLSGTGGTDFNVRQVRDIIPGTMGSEPEPVASCQNLVLFYATTLDTGRELWLTNGLEAQTALVADTAPGRGDAYPMKPRVTAAGKDVYLAQYGQSDRGIELWHFDFERNALESLGDIADDATEFSVYRGNLYFSNEESTHGWELWRYEPQTRQLHLYADLAPGPAPSSPGQFYVWKNRLLFQARTDALGVELWTADGGESPPTLVADINPGPADSKPYDFHGGESVLLFRAHDDAHGDEPWMSDLSAAGTRLLRDIKSGPASSTPYNLSVSRDRMMFSADDGTHGEELFFACRGVDGWKTALVADFLPGSTSSEPHDTVWLDDEHTLTVARGPATGDVINQVNVNDCSITIVNRYSLFEKRYLE